MRKISSEKTNYTIFFVLAIVIVSGAIYIERPASLASAMVPLQSLQLTPQEGPQGDGDGETNDDNTEPIQLTPQEGPQGDGDGETNDD